MCTEYIIGMSVQHNQIHDFTGGEYLPCVDYSIACIFVTTEFPEAYPMDLIMDAYSELWNDIEELNYLVSSPLEIRMFPSLLHERALTHLFFEKKKEMRQRTLA